LIKVPPAVGYTFDGFWVVNRFGHEKPSSKSTVMLHSA
jgi:hypothetical protein